MGGSAFQHALYSIESTRYGRHCVALILLLDFTVVLWIRGLSFSQYIEAFDPVAGTAYFVMLGVFAVMPLLVAAASQWSVKSLRE